MPRDPERRTFTEDARRAQLIGVTIDLVARHGYAGCSLQRIAAAAGITKAAVIYHFASKNEVIRAAYETVLTDMVDHVTERVEAADSPVAAVEAYLAAMIDYAGRHPNRIRMLIEAMVAGDETGVTDRPTSPDRARGLATLIRAAQADGGYRADVDADGLAIILGGAVDAVAAARLTDPELDLEAATAQLLDLLRHGTAARPGRAAE